MLTMHSVAAPSTASQRNKLPGRSSCFVLARGGITAELNRRDPVTAPTPGPTPIDEIGAEVDNQVAAPTELGTPTLQRAKTAQNRLRMEGWRQRRLSSKAKNPQKQKTKLS